MEFLKVAILNAPAKDEFVRLTKAHMNVFGDPVNPLDCKEHSYIELGGWIGDQGIALLYMALGVHLGVFNLMSPSIMIPGLLKEQAMQMAGQGFVIVQAYAGYIRSPEEQTKHEAEKKFKIVKLAIVVPEGNDNWMDLMSNLRDDHRADVLEWATVGDHRVVTKDEAEAIFRSECNDPDFFIDEDDDELEEGPCECGRENRECAFRDDPDGGHRDAN